MGATLEALISHRPPCNPFEQIPGTTGTREGTTQLDQRAAPAQSQGAELALIGAWFFPQARQGLHWIRLRALPG